MAKKKVKTILSDPRYLDFSLRYYDDLPSYVIEHCRYTPSWQQMDVLEAVTKPGSRVAVASGHGCFGAGTLIRLFDGSIKPVEEITANDVLVGDDGSPRPVFQLCYGVEPMYRFTFDDETEHDYNDQHILYLKNTYTGRMHRVAVQRWVEWSTRKKRKYCSVTAEGYEKHICACASLGNKPFFGFELEHSPLFLHADGTVLHNTGKSFIYAWVLDWHLRVFPKSNAILTATNLDQARSVIWKYLDGVIEDMSAIYPWQKNHFIKKTKSYHVKGFKDSWYVLPKTTSKATPENLAGQHNFNLLIVVDEASGVPDKNHGVLRGALTEERNRYLMASQPTRPIGHFAEAMTKLAKRTLPDGTVKGIYDAFTLNSEESPLVSKNFIREKLEEYGGHHSPEYQIKVLGRFPDNLAGYLIPKQWAEQSQYYKIDFGEDEDWGWVLTADVSEGNHRDSSTYTIAKVGGYGADRKVICVKQEEFLDKNEKEFARILMSVFYDEQYPNLSIYVDGDGTGRTVILDLEEQGIPVNAIHWGHPPHSEADKRRYLDLRAYSHLKLREGIFDERFKMVENARWVEQASKLPYIIDDRGRYRMVPKKQMKADGIKSPDLSDTTCFFYLADYIPVVKEEDRLEGDKAAWLEAMEFLDAS